MKDYEVTLSIHVYNVEKYIHTALFSALNQNFESIEFLIVDDKGTDRSMELVNEIVSTHLRKNDIRIIDNLVNKGLSECRNIAVREAKGKYLYFMDSDDEIVPECISILHKRILETDADMVVGSYVRKKEDKVISKDWVYEDMFTGFSDGLKELWLSRKLRKVHTPLWNKLYNLDFLRRNEILCAPQTRLVDDMYFTFLVMWNIKKLCFVSDITYLYYERSGALTDMGIKKNDKHNRIASEGMCIIDLKKKFLFKTTDPIIQSLLSDYIIREILFVASVQCSYRLPLRNKIESIDRLLKPFERCTGKYKIIYSILCSLFPVLKYIVVSSFIKIKKLIHA